VGGKSAEERQTVRRCGAKACPGFELRSLGQRGKQFGGESAEVVDVGGVNGLVETGVFDCCADDGAAGVGSGGSGNHIDFRCADDEFQGKRWG
jgi:hypothetical protein